MSKLGKQRRSREDRINERIARQVMVAQHREDQRKAFEEIFGVDALEELAERPVSETEGVTK